MQRLERLQTNQSKSKQEPLGASQVCSYCHLMHLNSDCGHWGEACPCCMKVISPVKDSPKPKPTHHRKTLEELLAEPYNPDPNLIVTIENGEAKVRLRRDTIKIAWSIPDED